MGNERHTHCLKSVGKEESGSELKRCNGEAGGGELILTKSDR